MFKYVHQLIGAASLLCTLTLLSPHGARAEKINILGGQSGATWSIIASSYANCISKATDGKAQVTVLLGSGLSNPIRLDRGDADVALVTSSAIFQAINGLGPYKKKLENFAALCSLCDDMNFQIVVPADSPYTSLREIVEKKMPVRINHGTKGTGAEQLIREVMQYYGASWNDVRSWGGRVYANSFQDGAGLFKDGVVDMFIWNGPGELGLITEMSLSRKLRWLPLDDDANARLTSLLGTKKGFLAASMYNNAVARDTPTASDTQGLYVRKDISDETAYFLTKTWIENIEEIAYAYPGLKKFSPEKAIADLGVPLHPGAARYYKERGWLK